jgi:hypothetical protein
VISVRPFQSIGLTAGVATESVIPGASTRSAGTTERAKIQIRIRCTRPRCPSAMRPRNQTVKMLVRVRAESCRRCQKTPAARVSAL